MLAKQTKQTHQFYTENQYLAIEETAEVKHEYRQESIIAMTCISVNLFELHSE